MRARIRAGQVWLFVCLCLVAALGFAATPAPDGLSTERFAQHVAFLASDELNGRGNGTPELDMAAEYIAREFEAYGLDALGDDGSFLQRFPIALSARMGPSNALLIDDKKQESGSDFVTLPLSTSGVYEGDVVFAGYGISAPQAGWDDYAGIDVAGKAVVVFSHYPPIGAAASAVHPLSFMSSFEMKARNAKRHGARVILFVVDPAFHADTLNSFDVALAAPHDTGVMVLYASRRSVEPLFEKQGTAISSVKRDIDARLRPASFAFTGSSIHVTTDVHRATTTAKNVVAAIPGSDPVLKNEWLVIGAHYDHLGRVRERTKSMDGVRTHHGADDNASGTAGLLELARALARDRSQLKRSVMFAAFAGEEVGLVGSGHFVDHAPVPLASIAAMLNLDMIGRLSRDPLHVMGVHVPDRVADWIRDENKDVGLTMAFSVADSASSDWAVFQAMGIPAVTFFTGIHADYHRSSDTADKINTAGAIKVLSVVNGTARNIARAEFSATRQPAGRSLTDADGEPYFGAEPILHGGLNALRFTSVLKDSPAAKAGVRSGDVVIEFGGFPAKTPNDFRMTLESFKPGDMPAVDVLRGGRPLRLVVTLEEERR